MGKVGVSVSVTIGGGRRPLVVDDQWDDQTFASTASTVVIIIAFPIFS